MSSPKKRRNKLSAQQAREAYAEVMGSSKDRVLDKEKNIHLLKRYGGMLFLRDGFLGDDENLLVLVPGPENKPAAQKTWALIKEHAVTDPIAGEAVALAMKYTMLGREMEWL